MADDPKHRPLFLPVDAHIGEPPIRILPVTIVRNAPAAWPVIDATVDAPFYCPRRAPVAREDVATINPYGDPRVVAVDPTIDHDLTPRKPPTHRPESSITIDVFPVLSDADEARAKLFIEGGMLAWRAAKGLFGK